MKNYYTFTFLILLLIVVQGKAQTDTSLWIAIECNAYKDYSGAANNDLTFQEIVASKELRSGAITAHFTQKQSLGEEAHQLGLNYFKRHKKGYMHIGGYHSAEDIFPTMIFDVNAYQLISKGILLMGGIRHMKYIDQKQINIYTLGTNVYRGNYLFSYSYSHISSNQSSHRVSLRRYMSDHRESVEVVGYVGGRDSRVIDFSEDGSERTTVWLAATKRLWDRIFLKCGLGFRSKNSEGLEGFKIPHHIGLKFIIGQ